MFGIGSQFSLIQHEMMNLLISMILLSLVIFFFSLAYQDNILFDIPHLFYSSKSLRHFSFNLICL